MTPYSGSDLATTMASFSPLQLFYGSVCVLFAFPLSTWSLLVQHTIPKDGFERMVAFWSEKRCVFPDPLTYKYDVVTGGFLLEPCSHLDPNSIDSFNRELCYQFLDVSKLLCKAAPQQEYLKAEVLSQLVDNPQWNVCNIARTLSTKQRFAFITQDPGACASHCMADNKLGQICKLLIAAVAKYEESLRSSSGPNPAASQPAGSDKDTKAAERPQPNVTSKNGDPSGQQGMPSQANGEMRAPPPENNSQDSQTGRGPESSASEQGNGGTLAPTRGAPGLPASGSEQGNGGMPVSKQGNGRAQAGNPGIPPASEQGNGGTLAHIEADSGIPPASEQGNGGTLAPIEGDSGIPPASDQGNGGTLAHIEGDSGIPPASEQGNGGTLAPIEGDSGIPPASEQGNGGTLAPIEGDSGMPPASEQGNGGTEAHTEGDSGILPASEQGDGGTQAHIEGNSAIPPASEPGNRGTEAHTEGDSGIPTASEQGDGGTQAHIKGNSGIPPSGQGNGGTLAHIEGDSGRPPASVQRNGGTVAHTEGSSGLPASGQGNGGTLAHIEGDSGRPPASVQRNGGTVAHTEGSSGLPASGQGNSGTLAHIEGDSRKPTQNGGDLGASKSDQGDVETPIHAGANTLQQGNSTQSTQQGGGAYSEKPHTSDSPEGAKTPPGVDVAPNSPEGSLNMPVNDRTSSTSTSTSTTPDLDMWMDEEDGDPVGNGMSVKQQLPDQGPVPPQPALIPADGVQHLHHMVENDFDEDMPTSGHFMAYFVTTVVLCVAGYVIYHNKQKILAFVLEGRRDSQRRRASSGGNGGSTAKYTKLQPSVEEVMPSLEKSTTSKSYIY